VRPAPLQLDLFRQPDRQVIERLRKVDISRLTPLEALNLLNQLREMALPEAGSERRRS
jgi:hypothetical protein